MSSVPGEGADVCTECTVVSATQHRVSASSCLPGTKAQKNGFFFQRDGTTKWTCSICIFNTKQKMTTELALLGTNCFWIFFSAKMEVF